MRLRKLGHGQSLAFFAPPEVHQDILRVTGQEGGHLAGKDVVAWSLEQSCLSIERSQPLMVLQGLGYQQRREIAHELSILCPELQMRALEAAPQGAITEFKENYDQTLSNLYAPTKMRDRPTHELIQWAQNREEPAVQQLLQLWNRLDPLSSTNASMHEEQEREVAHEIEREVQVERPPNAKPLQPSVDPNLLTFVMTGRSGLHCFSNAFTGTAGDVSIKELLMTMSPLVGLRMTRDFAQVIERSSAAGYLDNYLRPASWVLMKKSAQQLLLVSQFEVNQLFEKIKASNEVTLHAYNPRVTKVMVAVDRLPVLVDRRLSSQAAAPSWGTLNVAVLPSALAWRSIDTNLRRQLHLFAGQLYVDNYEEYLQWWKDLAIDSKNRDFHISVTALKAWIAVRRKGQNFLQTHVGQITSERVLKEDAFNE